MNFSGARAVSLNGAGTAGGFTPKAASDRTNSKPGHLGFWAGLLCPSAGQQRIGGPKVVLYVVYKTFEPEETHVRRIESLVLYRLTIPHRNHYLVRNFEPR
jgi:hypothetical protein